MEKILALKEIVSPPVWKYATRTYRRTKTNQAKMHIPWKEFEQQPGERVTLWGLSVPLHSEVNLMRP